MLGITDLYKKVEGDIDAIIQAQANIIRISQEHKNTTTGVLRIGTTHTQARFFLPQAVVEFRKSFPNIRLVFRSAWLWSRDYRWYGVLNLGSTGKLISIAY